MYVCVCSNEYATPIQCLRRSTGTLIKLDVNPALSRHWNRSDLLSLLLVAANTRQHNGQAAARPYQQLLCNCRTTAGKDQQSSYDGEIGDGAEAWAERDGTLVLLLRQPSPSSMVRKETAMRLPPQHQGLEVKIPSFFRCPISLDVMRSPVSLCTGVTYDRASIQRWLDSGNTTCPATMLPLPSTDLVPNLTLRSLIAHWAAASASCSPTAAAGSADSTVRRSPASLVRMVASSAADPSSALRQLAAHLSDDDVDDFEKNALVGAGGAAEAVASVLRRKGEEYASVEAVEAAVRVLAGIVASGGIEDANKKRVAAGLAADAAASARSLARVMRRGSGGLEARVDAARLAELLLANAADEARAAAAESSELVAELVRLVGPVDEKGTLDKAALDAGLSCLAAIADGPRRAARGEMVRLGAVPAAARALRAATDPHASAKALRILEAAVGCAEGRAALCQDAEDAVPAVIGKMMKAGRGGAEAAVAVLWAVCHRYRDRRAVDAAAAADGGLTKLLLLMQSGCSPAARQMALELLKIYKVNAKSCLAGYDSKTTHIMPF